MLRIPDAEFWDLTFDEFDARLFAWEEEQRQWDLRFGVVGAAFLNCHLKEGTEPIKPGSLFGYTYEEDDYEMSEEETFAHIKAITDRHNARIAKKKTP